MNRRDVECDRCGKPIYAYPSEAGQFYCETVRCESTEPQRQEKNGPDSPAKKTPGPLNSKDTQEGASIMTDTTADQPTSTALQAALEERTGRKVETVDDFLAYAREHGTTATQLMEEAQTDAAEWHPWWCARGEMCSPASRDGDIHYSPPRRLVADLPSEGPDGGESFTAGVAAVALTEWGEVFDQCAVLSIENRCGVGDIELHLGVNTMRDLADWLMQMADMIEQVHAGQRPDLAELEGAISNG